MPSDAISSVRRPMTGIVFLIVGAAFGAAAALLWARGQLAAKDARLAGLEQSRGDWEARLQAATGDALLKSQSSLLELAEARLAPIKETLVKFETQARQLEEKRTR